MKSFDYWSLSLDECRITEVASETRIEQVKTEISSVLSLHETSKISNGNQEVVSFDFIEPYIN
jgi:hypothetical protein